MSVYIKGMEMPISCERCPMLDWDLDYIKCKVTDRHFKMTECWRAIRVPDCPLVPAPPHGRLIDADAFISQKREQICKNCNRRRGMKDGKLTKRFVYAIGDAPCRACGIGDMLDYVEDAPTIIPAEEGE